MLGLVVMLVYEYSHKWYDEALAGVNVVEGVSWKVVKIGVGVGACVKVVGDTLGSSIGGNYIWSQRRR